MSEVPPEPTVEFLLRMRREAELRRQHKDPSGVFLAVFGLDTLAQSFRVQTKADGQFLLEPLEASPAVAGSELTRSLHPTHQIALVGSEIDMRERWIVDGMFWTTSALLRLASDGFFVTCELADHSWDVIDGCRDATIHSPMPGRSLPAWWPRQPTSITAEVWDWVAASLEQTLEMRANRTFHFALEAFWGSFDEPDPRMAASKVWAGIESLFGIQIELRFRLALFAATILEPPGEARLSKYRKIVKLYDQRSKVVHGGPIGTQEVVDHVIASQDVLRGLIRDSLARHHVLTAKEIEAALLGASQARSGE